MPPLSINFFLIIGGAIAGVLLLVGVIVSVTSEKALVHERLDRYIEEEDAQTLAGSKGDSVNPLTDWMNTKVEHSSFGESIAKELARADIKFKPGEYVALMLISAFITGVLVWFISSRYLFFGLIGMVIGLFLPRLYVRREQGRRLIRFNEQLGDMLNLMVNGLRAGYSTMQAMEAVSKELPSPICDEFRRLVQELQLGLPMERALDNLLRRIPSEDLDLIVTAINVQREVGGNLAEILDTISYTIRERVRIKGEIRVLTSQVMYSGRFLSLLPVLLIM
ncbi:MAG TPA: type II secretion system F family protein, partial [Anaerolineaceae bacterium]|nr:type II secretion system F family protein [Anaerolineaceae bacterium]